MFRSKRAKTIGIIIFVIGICVFFCMNLYWELDEWASYDPKVAAQERVRQTINAAYEGSTMTDYRELVPSCGGLWLHNECWGLLQEEAKSSSNDYDMKVIYYNWEDDERPWRGGDEITVEVEFANGTTVYVYTYESCIDYCSLK